MRVGVAYVDVRVNMTQYKTDLNKLATMASTAATQVNANLSKIGVGYSKLGTQSAATATGMRQVTSSATKQSKSMLGLIPHVVAVTGAYMAMRTAWRAVLTAVTAGVEFEKKMSAVKAISRATAVEFANLGSAARQMAADTVFTATQTADALRYLAMAGFSANESIAALPGVLQLALIGELELGRATDIATDTLKAFGLEADEITRVVDVMVSVITRSNTNIEMMGQAMKFAAPVAKALGYEIEEVAAMIGVLATAGVKAGIAGRNLQQAFVRTTKAARSLGLAVGSDLIDVLKKYNEIQNENIRTYGRVAAAEMIAMKITKDYGLIALKSILILKDNVDAYEKLALAAYLSAGEAAEAAMIMQDNVDSAYKRLKSIIQEISISIFDDYKVGLKLMLEDTTRWFHEHKDGIKAFASYIIDVLGVMARFIGGITKTIGAMWSAIPDWAKSMLKMADPFARLSDLLNHIKLIQEGGALPAKEKFYGSIDKELGTSTPDIARSINAHSEALRDNVIAMQSYNDEIEKTVELESLLAVAMDNLENAEIDRALTDFFKEIDDPMLEYLAAIDKITKAHLDKMAPSVRKVYDEQVALKRVREAATEQFAFMAQSQPILAKKMADEVVATYKKKQKAHAKGLTDAQKDLDAHFKYVAKTNDMMTKSSGDKFDVQAAQAKRYGDEMLAKYLALDAAERKIWDDAGRDKEGIARDTADRILAIEYDKWDKSEMAEEDFYVASSIRKAKDVDQAALNAKDQLELSKLLLGEMTANDEGYFELKALSRQADYDALVLKYGETKEVMAIRSKWEQEDMKERALAHGTMIDGMKVGLLDYLDDMKTWGEAGKEIFDLFVSGVTSASSDTLYAVLKGDFDSIGDIWSSLWDTMLRKFTDILAEMMMQWAISGIADLFGLQIGGGTSPLSLGGLGGIEDIGSQIFSGIQSLFGGGATTISSGQLASQAGLSIKGLHSALGSSTFSGMFGAAGTGTMTSGTLASMAGMTQAELGVALSSPTFSAGGGLAASGLGSLLGIGAAIAAPIVLGPMMTGLMQDISGALGMGKQTAPGAGQYLSAWDQNAVIVDPTWATDPSKGGVGWQTNISPNTIQSWLTHQVYGTNTSDPYSSSFNKEFPSDLALKVYNRELASTEAMYQLRREEMAASATTREYEALAGGHQFGGVLKASEMISMGKGEPFFRGLPGEGVISHKGMRALEELNSGVLANSIVEAVDRANTSSGGSDRPIIVNINIDGKQIGSCVAKQYRSHTELIKATRMAIV